MTTKSRAAKDRAANIAARQLAVIAAKVPRPTEPILLRSRGGAGGFKMTDAGAAYYGALRTALRFDEISDAEWNASKDFPTAIKIGAECFGVSPGMWCGLGLVWDRDHPVDIPPAPVHEPPKSRTDQPREGWEDFYRGSTD